ncbi:MAG: phosphate acyltransferase PlsX [Dehalococcoidia bacterium]|nr:MAG: phosphate acyltransferase PlsX [Dehalococcoidia bacterium]
MIIAVDATGGEYAPHEIVKGAIKAAQDYKVSIALVGTRSTLHVLASRHLKKLDFSFIEANQIIGPQESPIRAVNNKPRSPIVVGVKLVKDGTAAAFVSAGNTGAVLYASLLILGKIKGVERPAIASPINIGAAPSLLIDSGANADCRPSHLVQFANLGAAYSQHVLGIPSPRVGLLSNGEEESKGNRLVQETYQLLKKANLNFIGNIEGQDIAGRKADVIVTDGFTGNVVLKTIEGLGSTFQNLQQPVGQALTGTSRLQGRLLLSIAGLDSWIKRIDYREYGGACLLGVNGNITIAHGRSRAKAIKNAIGLAKQTAEGDLCQIIKGGSLDRTVPEE